MEQIAISSVRPHPENPRRGNITAIADSLKTNGQYKPILVHRPTMHILAGTHTWKAAKQLGWQTITAVFTDVDNHQARAILLSDNRAADAGYTDDTAAFAILATLPSLDGTGYTADDLHIPAPPDIDEWDVNDTEPQDRNEPPEREEPDHPEDTTERFEIGPHRGRVDGEHYAQWRDQLPPKPAAAAEALLTRLGLGVAPAPQPTPTQAAEVTPISSLEEYPGNPRQGDIGLIADLLKRHGQTRPITVNRRTRRILTGNHLTAAARQLGWTHIWVAWVDVDDDGEKRILLADNRTSDLATYDTDALGRALATVGPNRIQDTGFTLPDLDDVIAGRQIRETTRTGGTWIRVGKITAKTTHTALAALNLTPGRELAEAAYMIGLDPNKVAALPSTTT